MKIFVTTVRETRWRAYNYQLRQDTNNNFYIVSCIQWGDEYTTEWRAIHNWLTFDKALSIMEKIAPLTEWTV